MRALSLFSGIGGIDLALEDYATTVGYVEINKYAQSVLLSRMVDGSINTAPIHRDITRLDGRKLRGHVELIFGGFPCQDISVAGRGEGLDGERSGLFFEICRLIKEIQPVFIFLENVPAIRTRGLDVVLKELAALGYDCRWTVISAASVGAPHKRERWFLLAHANSKHLRNTKESKFTSEAITRNNGKKKLMGDSKHNGHTSTEITRSNGKDDGEESKRAISPIEPERTSEHRNVSKNFSNVGNAVCIGSQRSRESIESKRSKEISNGEANRFKYASKPDFWATEPDVGRVANGVQFRMERLKCLGNACVPLQGKKAFERLIGI
jgi:DNA (cytosine-5)-methyltransferase 1